MGYNLFLIVCAAFGSVWLLWVFFLAVMNLKRAKAAGLLSWQAKLFGYPVVWLGYAIDFTVNTLPMSALLIELPQWQLKELLVTDRLKRLRRTDKRSGWQRDVAEWFVTLLNPFDPDGDHI